MPHHLSNEMRHCMQECYTCRAVCQETITHCLRKGGVHAAADHIRLMADCADICGTSGGFLARGSPLHERTCAVCAEACEQCARDCERMADDEEMRRCAQVCHDCAESCRQMAGALA